MGPAGQLAGPPFPKMPREAKKAKKRVGPARPPVKYPSFKPGANPTPSALYVCDHCRVGGWYIPGYTAGGPVHTMATVTPLPELPAGIRFGVEGKLEAMGYVRIDPKDHFSPDTLMTPASCVYVEDGDPSVVAMRIEGRGGAAFYAMVPTDGLPEPKCPCGVDARRPNCAFDQGGYCQKNEVDGAWDDMRHAFAEAFRAARNLKWVVSGYRAAAGGVEPKHVLEANEQYVLAHQRYLAARQYYVTQATGDEE